MGGKYWASVEGLFIQMTNNRGSETETWFRVRLFPLDHMCMRRRETRDEMDRLPDGIIKLLTPVIRRAISSL